MKLRYCLNNITDMANARAYIETLGGTVVFNPVYHNGRYQCWFDVDGPIEMSEDLTFFKLKFGTQDLVPVKVETY